MKIGIFCDCHNTLMNSNEAWVKAFAEHVGDSKIPEIQLNLYGKVRRRDLANKYNIDFFGVEQSADKYIKRNEKLISLLEMFQMVGFPLFVVSNAPRYRVMKDLEITGLIDLFQKIMTGDEGGKQYGKIFNDIIEEYGLDGGVFIGNEEFEDYICHDKITSLILADFLRFRHKIVGNYRLNENGIMQNTLIF